MHRFLISVLLAGAAATPAIAGLSNSSDPQQKSDNHQQASDNHQQARDNHQQAREERQSAREQRQSARDEHVQAHEQLRGDRGGNANGGQFEGNARPDRINVPQQSYGGGVVVGGGADRYSGRPERGNFSGRVEGYQGDYVAPGPRVVTPRSRFAGRNDQVNERNLRQSGRTRVVSNVPRPGTQPPLRVEGGRAGSFNWNRGWRNDNRYDWRRYRNHHRSQFHPSLYLDPFGWGYEPFSIGWRLWPAYYDNQYWIDPGMYELPYPPPGAVWVRYWNDALLVDTYSGTVIDVIPGFFW
ncbi:MAG TPA: RcnB family protein [Sphingomicrobium sp.]|jgi:Ni/Co efflux regulator RcnB|nr:RcnB family protein [Sphingomicrobium sp.]